MNAEVMFKRLDESIQQVENRHKFYVRLNTWTSMLSIVLSSSIPILISMASRHVSLLLIVSIFSALITLIQTFKSTFNLSDKIQNLSVVVTAMKKEQLLLVTHTAPYDGTDEENMHLLAHKLADNADEFIQHLEDNNN